MKTLICRTCGCSLVRLGISNVQAVAYSYNGDEHHFCCQGCTDVFITDPQKYLEETSNLIVCPSCLAEKPLDMAIMLSFDRQEMHFCRCPYCVEVFEKDPDFYIKRLEGTIPNDGAVLDHEACCIRPESV